MHSRHLLCLLSSITIVAGLVTLPCSSSHAASRRFSAVGNCELHPAGGVDVDGNVIITDAASGEPALGYKFLVGQSDEALCTVPSDTTLAHADVTTVNVHLNYAEPDCTGTNPAVYLGVLSYNTGSYSELPATMNKSGCNFTFTGNSGTQLTEWWTEPSWFPMVRVVAGLGEPIFIRGIWMQS
jgi:hypothetical protein